MRTAEDDDFRPPPSASTVLLYLTAPLWLTRSSVFVSLNKNLWRKGFFQLCLCYRKLKPENNDLGVWIEFNLGSSPQFNQTWLSVESVQDIIVVYFVWSKSEHKTAKTYNRI